MSQFEGNERKKRGRPATGRMPVVAVRITPFAQKALEQVLLDPRFQSLSLSDTIRSILDSWLEEHGYMDDVVVKNGEVLTIHEVKSGKKTDWQELIKTPRMPMGAVGNEGKAGPTDETDI